VEQIYTRSVAVLIACFAPFALGCGVLAKTGLDIWLGAEFANRGYQVAQVVAIGVLANGVASVPFALLQASGRPDITAKLHLLELPLYVAAVYVFTTHLGVVGTAVAWTGRVTLDAALLLRYSPVRLKFRRLGP
jgi:O-antigen/teichoic acid export membrane protein